MRILQRAIAAPLAVLTGSLLPRAVVAAYPLYGSPGVTPSSRMRVGIFGGKEVAIIAIVIGCAIAVLFGAFLIAFLMEALLRRSRPDARDTRPIGMIAKRFTVYWGVTSVLAVLLISIAAFLFIF